MELQSETGELTGCLVLGKPVCAILKESFNIVLSASVKPAKQESIVSGDGDTEIGGTTGPRRFMSG
jgi:hypothetical protein